MAERGVPTAVNILQLQHTFSQEFDVLFAGARGDASMNSDCHHGAVCNPPSPVLDLHMTT
jgi:hypothetical protein